MDTVIFAHPKQCKSSLRLQKRFSAGQGHSALFPVEGTVSLNFRKDFLGCHFGIGELQRFGTADLHTAPASGAKLPVKNVCMILYTVCACGTNRPTGSASDALSWIKQDLPVGGLGLRVMTPSATKRTSLQKYHGAYSRAVRHTKALYFRDFHLFSFILGNDHNAVLRDADLVRYICPGYSRACFQIRNEWMVNHSSLVIAVFNGQPSGTKNTIDYAIRTQLQSKTQ